MENVKVHIHPIESAEALQPMRTRISLHSSTLLLFALELRNFSFTSLHKCSFLLFGNLDIFEYALPISSKSCCIRVKTRVMSLFMMW